MNVNEDISTHTPAHSPTSHTYNTVPTHLAESPPGRVCVLIYGHTVDPHCRGVRSGGEEVHDCFVQLLNSSIPCMADSIDSKAEDHGWGA